MRKDKSADGLRGMAAMIVVISHSLLAFFPGAFTVFFPWVASPSAAFGAPELFLSTPVLSVLWNGGFSVLVFFVLSGYVLTKSMVEAGDTSIARALAARRYVRLAGPVLASALLACSLMLLGLYHSAEVAELTGSAWLRGMWNATPDFLSAIREGLFGAMFLGEVSYNPVFWTMRIEFFGSLMILAYRIIASTRCRQLFGATIYIGLTIAVAPQEWVAYLAFLLGTHLNDIRALPRRAGLVLLAVLGLYLGGVNASQAYAWVEFVPIDAAYRNSLVGVFGAAMLVYAVKSGALSAFLTSQPLQFLGRISYSLYLVHLPLILSLACGLYAWLLANGGVSRVVAAALSLGVSIPATLLCALVFTIWFDEPCIRLSRRILPDWKRPSKNNRDTAPIS